MKYKIKNGNLYTFIDEIDNINNILTKFNYEIKETNRVSLIIPKNIYLRFFFILLRKFNNKHINNFTRRWNCKWIVIVNNKKIGEFEDRKKAIEYEKEYINNIDFKEIYNKKQTFVLSLIKF